MKTVKIIKTIKIIIIIMIKEINLQLVRVTLLAVHYIIIIITATLNIYISIKIVMSVIRRIMSLRIVIISLK